jgi:SOS-response transcriptional repressor LexA
MKEMMNIVGILLRQRRKALKMTLRQAAKFLGCSEQTVQRIETGTQQGFDFFLGCKICRLYKLDPQSLALGKARSGLDIINGGEQRFIESSAELPIMADDFPVITWEEAGGKIKKFDDVKDLEKRELISISGSIGLQSFILRMQGDAMFSTNPLLPGFSHGEILVFDPCTKPEVGDHVLVRNPKRSTAIFRQLTIDCGEPMLTALNPAYPLEALTKEHNIVAVWVHSSRYRSKTKVEHIEELLPQEDED